MPWSIRGRLSTAVAALVRPSTLTPVAILVLGLVITALGFADLPKLWILAGTGLLTVAGWFIGLSLEPETDPAIKVRYLGCTIALLLLVIVGSWSYPAFTQPDFSARYFVLVGANETQCLKSTSRPGGETLTLAPSVCGGDPVAVRCRVTREGDDWLRLYSTPHWVPRVALEPVTPADDDLPTCD